LNLRVFAYFTCYSFLSYFDHTTKKTYLPDVTDPMHPHVAASNKQLSIFQFNELPIGTRLRKQNLPS